MARANGECASGACSTLAKPPAALPDGEPLDKPLDITSAPQPENEADYCKANPKQCAPPECDGLTEQQCSDLFCPYHVPAGQVCRAVYSTDPDVLANAGVCAFEDGKCRTLSPKEIEDSAGQSGRGANHHPAWH